MGKVIKLKLPGKIKLCCEDCGKQSFELVFDETTFDEDHGGVCFLVCRARGCGNQLRATIDWGVFLEGAEGDVDD